MMLTPTKDTDFAEALGVSSAQAKVWLKRLLVEGVIEKQRKPPGYIVRQSNMFE
jgi:DNA processing protein